VRSRCRRKSEVGATRRDEVRVIDVADTLHAVHTVIGRGRSEEKRSGLVGSVGDGSGLELQGDVGSRKLLSDAGSTADLSLLLSAERSGGAEEAGSSVARNVARTARSSRRSSRRQTVDRVGVGVVAAEHGELRELAVHDRHGRNIGISVGVGALEPASDAVLGRAAAGDAEGAVLGWRTLGDSASLGHVGHG
jgi:hypothetical protein